MIEIPSTIKDVYNSQTPQYVKRVELFVRRWNDTAQAYEYDAALDITEHLVEAGTISWKFDTEEYGKWGRSSCTLTLQNRHHEFLQDNPAGGYFSEGTALFRSKVRIIAGARNPDDDTTETTYIYTGYICSDPTYYDDEKTVQIVIQDHMSVFEQFSAEGIGTDATEQFSYAVPGDNDTVNKEFTTTNKACGLVLTVKKGTTAGGESAATTLTVSTDYNTSQLNEHDLGGKITLEQALVADESLWVTYRYWYIDKPIDWVINQLCDVVGLSTTEVIDGVSVPMRVISPVIFEGDIKNSWQQSTEDDFDLGTDSETDHTSGDVLLKTPFLINTGWNGVGYVASTQAYGTWQMPIFYNNRWPTAAAPNYLCFMSSNMLGTGTGYALAAWQEPISGTEDYQKYIGLRRFSGGTFISIYRLAINSSCNAIRISRTSDGQFYMWLKDSVSGWRAYGLIVTDATYSSSSYMVGLPGIWSESPYYIYTGASYHAQIATGSGDYPPEGIYTSPVIDGTSSLKYWGKVTSSIANPTGCTSWIEIRTSADSSTWGEWTKLDTTGAILTANRYIQLRWKAYADSTLNLTPTLGEWKVDFYTSQTPMHVVNMTGLKCSDALTSLAQMSGYEIGFNGSDVFVFRPRTSTVTEVDVIDNSKIREVSSITPGYDNLYNRVTVSFGDYTKTVDPDTMGDAKPHALDIYGIKELSISSGNFLPASGVDLAYAIAPTVYKYVCKGARRRVTVKTKFFIHLELGDKIKMMYSPADLYRLWKGGDTDITGGQEGIYGYNDDYLTPRLPLYNRYFRIEGIELDVETWTTTFNLVEVI